MNPCCWSCSCSPLRSASLIVLCFLLFFSIFFYFYLYIFSDNCIQSSRCIFLSSLLSLSVYSLRLDWCIGFFLFYFPIFLFLLAFSPFFYLWTVLAHNFFLSRSGCCIVIFKLLFRIFCKRERAGGGGGWGWGLNRRIGILPTL